MSLSERIRSGCEAAPWVSDEVQNLEATNAELCEEVQKLEALNAELLEALERCFDIMNNGGTWSLEDQAAARAAIAKAKGEQS